MSGFRAVFVMLLCAFALLLSACDGAGLRQQVENFLVSESGSDASDNGTDSKLQAGMLQLRASSSIESQAMAGALQDKKYVCNNIPNLVEKLSTLPDNGPKNEADFKVWDTDNQYMWTKYIAGTQHVQGFTRTKNGAHVISHDLDGGRDNRGMLVVEYGEKTSWTFLGTNSHPGGLGVCNDVVAVPFKTGGTYLVDISTPSNPKVLPYVIDRSGGSVALAWHPVEKVHYAAWNTEGGYWCIFKSNGEGLSSTSLTFSRTKCFEYENIPEAKTTAGTQSMMMFFDTTLNQLILVTIARFYSAILSGKETLVAYEVKNSGTVLSLKLKRAFYTPYGDENWPGPNSRWGASVVDSFNSNGDVEIILSSRTLTGGYGFPYMKASSWKMPFTQKTSAWTVHIDCYNYGASGGTTGDTVSIQYFSQGLVLEATHRIAGISTCWTKDASFQVTSARSITSVRVSISGSDAFFIDKIKLEKEGDLIKSWGEDGGAGWCLSTEANDINDWSSQATQCLPTIDFDVARGVALDVLGKVVGDKKSLGAKCDSNGQCYSGKCGRIAAGSDTLQCCEGLTSVGFLDYCTKRTENTPCWSNVMCSSGYCTNGIGTKGVCITRKAVGVWCSRDVECASGACGYFAAGAPYQVCCATKNVYLGNDYCGNMPSGYSCWSDAMCASRYCGGNWGGSKKGKCR